MFSSQKTAYSSLPRGEEDDDDESSSTIPEKQSASTSKPQVRYTLISGALVLSILIIIALTASFSGQGQQHSPTATWTSCGEDKATALARNCSFDLISFAWQTPECFDYTLVSEFAAWDDWKFYLWFNGSVVIPQSVAMQGETDLHVDWQYHVTHCTFMWRQMHRAYERGYIDSHLRAYNHTLHCQKMLLKNDVPMDKVFTGAPVIYPTCERVGGAAAGSDSGMFEGGMWNSKYRGPSGHDDHR